MKLVIQRVLEARVKVDSNIIGQINQGLLVFLGIHEEDTEEKIDWLVNKLCKLRIFEDDNQKMNLSVKDINGDILIVSQFTLYANCERGNRPDFISAAKPEKANHLYNLFIKQLKTYQIKVETGIFGANMKISLINDGPVTVIIER